MAFLTAGAAGSASIPASATVTIDTTGAKLIVIVGSDTHTSLTTPSDSVGGNSNVWTLHGATISGTGGGGTRDLVIWWLENPTHVGASHAFTFGSVAPAIAVACFDDVAASSIWDSLESAGANSTGTTVSTGTTGTPSQANNLIIAACGGDPLDAMSINSGFTIVAHLQKAAGVHLGVCLAYKSQSSATAQNPQFTIASDGEAKMAVADVFKINAWAGGGGGLPIPVAMNLYRQQRNFRKRPSGVWTPDTFMEANKRAA